MKTLPLSLLLIINLTAGIRAQQPNDQKELIRKANVKKVTSVSIPKKQRFVSEYDRRGNLIQRVGSGLNGSPVLQESYKYDDKDNPIETVVDGIRHTYTYKYDDNGQILETKQFDAAGKLRLRTEYIVDDSGRVRETLTYTGTGQLSAKHVLKRDDEGNVIENLKFGPQGNLLEKQVHTYRGKNVVMQSLISGPNGNVTSKIVYEYAGDRLTRQSIYGANENLLRRNVFRRDPKGLVLEELQTNEKGEPVERTTSEYEFHP